MRIGIIQTESGHGGGNIYLNQVANALSERFEVNVYRTAPQIMPKRATVFLRSWLRQVTTFPDVWILPEASWVAEGWRILGIPTICLFHHHDPTVRKRDLLERFLNNRFWKGLRAADRVVVVANFWKTWLADKGIERTLVAPNAFDISNLEFEREDILAFRDRICPRNKKLIYLGNSGSRKGSAESFRALEDLEAEYVVSGKLTPLPALHMDLSHRDYMKLLAASDVVVTMSTFEEGWNRTAHEAMLVGTPVVGSGRGGMRELLVGGGQIVCPQFGDLQNAVELALKGGTALGTKGRQYATAFDLASFQTTWLGVLDGLKVNKKHS